MTLTDINQLIGEQAEKASQEWYRLQCQNPYAEIYLYYRRGELGVFAAGSAPEGWSLGDQARLSPACSRQQIKNQMREAARRLPFLPV